jgi:hypothetical protein
MSKFDSFKAGQLLHCTLTKAPRSAGAESTIARLMRNDADSKRGLRKSQKIRRQTMLVYNRGNRDWTSRKTCGKVVHVAPGQDWTMAFDFSLLPDLKSVEEYLDVRAK